MIEVKHITKKYGDHLAVKDLSFTIEPGKIYGFLGPNGAGKSTTMNIIAGTLAATDGTVLINGHDIYEDPINAKRCIGYLPEIPPLYTDMTPFEFLTFVAEAKGVEYEKILKRVKEVMELTQLLDVKDRLIRNLSKGYRQRVGIAQAMLGDPDIIILDEPTVGLDPYQIIEIRELIKNLGKSKTVIVSSHILAEIAEICDHIMIISGGRLVANDTLESLESQVNRADTLHLSVKSGKDAACAVIATIPGVVDVEAEEKGDVCSLTVSIEKGVDPRESIFFAFADARLAILSMSLETVTLESVFLELTSEDIDGEGTDTDCDVDEDGDDTFTEDEEDNTSEDEEDDTAPVDKEEVREKKPAKRKARHSKDDDNDDDYTPLFS